jgi:hypothetical protein
MVNDQLTAALTEQLSQQAGSDPIMAMLLQQMTSTPPAEANEELAELRSRLERAIRKIERLGAELAAANAMAAYVARVLGACERCWGMDQFCRGCLGRGHPGSSPPDVGALIDWVSPALQRAGLTTIPRASDETGPTLREQEGGHHAAV